METSVNNKCRAFTSLEQSRKLSEFLPLESADMWYHGHGSPLESEREYDNDACPFHSMRPNWDEPCWSLAALINILPNGSNIVKEEADTENEKYMCTVGIKDDIISTFADNPVDACFEMIIRLHELNLL